MRNLPGLLAGAAATAVIGLLGFVSAADAKRCDASYKGACLNPNASDYDCAGGSGNGPYYVRGPIRVVGPDHYDLDRDRDGIACED